MITIDGSHGEGGGQILRSSLTLAALTGESLHIHHIRSKRSQPGLRPQHLAAVKAIAKLTRADVTGAERDSTEVTLRPTGLHEGRYQFDIPTAGALTLVLQTIFLLLSYAAGRSRVILTGGTHVQWSPNYHYLTEQWMPWMRRFGFRAQTDLQKAGFYPAGGGEVSLNLLPANELRPFSCLKRGNLQQIRGFSGIANLEDDIARRQKHQALKRLYEICQNSKIKTLRMPAHGKGTFILLKADFTNCGSACFTALGAPGKPAERVADEAVDKMVNFLQTQGCVDHYLADQILLPLSLMDSESEFRTDSVTQHLLTNAHIIRQFLPVKIDIEGEVDQPGLIHIVGTANSLWNK